MEEARLGLGFTLGVKGFGGVFSNRRKTSSRDGVGVVVMIASNGREPSLYDAKARVARAGEHIKSLEREVARWGFHGPMSPAIKTASMGFTPSALCSILIGEIAYNLKAALDYLVFELFYLATGKFNNSTKFIIVDTPEEWTRYFPQTDTPRKVAKKLWLHELRAEHQAVLKGLQPFSGTNWTKTLQKITNPDRHRQLIQIAGMIDYTQIDRLSETRAAAIPAAFPAEMFVHFEVTSKITLQDGAHAIEAMQHLVREHDAILTGRTHGITSVVSSGSDPRK